MNGVLWQKTGLSRPFLSLAALLALFGLLALELVPSREAAADFAPKYRASERAANAFAALKAESLRRGIMQDLRVDPTQSGLIGLLQSPLTTNHGLLSAKQTSVNPNFAALILGYLNEAHLQRGDVVAVGFSGSFPALNVAVLAALETLGARALVISGVGSSQWGANRVGFSWPEMDAFLFRNGLFSTRSLALSRGGIEDRALGLDSADLAVIDAVLAASGLPVLQNSDSSESVSLRMAFYETAAQGAPIAAYINVGGGTTSLGGKPGRNAFPPGLLLAPLAAPSKDSVMARFAARGVPLIHVNGVSELARRAGFPQTPQVAPQPGQGAIYERLGPNRILATTLFAALIALLVWGARRQRRRLAKLGGTC